MNHNIHQYLTDSFVQFFNDKIEKLQQKVEATDMPPLSVQINETCTTSFAEFDIQKKKFWKQINQLQLPHVHLTHF